MSDDILSDDWSDLQSMWAEQETPKFQQFQREYRRASLSLTLMHSADWLATLALTGLGLHIIADAADWAERSVGVLLISVVLGFMVFVHRYRRSMWAAPQGSTKSLLEFSRRRSEKNLFLLRITPISAALSFPLGILTAVVIRDRPYETPLAERLLFYGLFWVGLVVLSYAFCRYRQHRTRAHMQRVDELLEELAG